MIDGIDVTFLAGRIVGLVLVCMFLVWIGRKIDSKLRGKSNDSDTEKP